MEPSANKLTVNFWLLAIFFALTLGGTTLGVLYLARANALTADKIAINKEATRPANLEALIINDQNCADCFRVEPILDNLKSASVNLTGSRLLDRADAEAQALMEKYAIEKLPVLILRGEVDKDANLKTALLGAGTVEGDTFVLRQVGGPYVLSKSGAIRGQTELTLLSDASCDKCYNVTQHQAILPRFGLNPKVKTVDAASAEGRALIRQYQITLIPTFVLTGEVKEYPAFLKIWPQVGAVKNNAYIFTTGVPSMGVHKNLKTGKIIDPAETAKK